MTKKLFALLLAAVMTFALVACTVTTPVDEKPEEKKEETQDPAEQKDPKELKTELYHEMAADGKIAIDMSALDISIAQEGANIRIAVKDGYYLMQILDNLMETVRYGTKMYLHARVTYAGETTEEWYCCEMSDEESASMAGDMSQYTDLVDNIIDITYLETVTVDGISCDKVTVKAATTEEGSGEPTEEEAVAYFTADTNTLYKIEAKVLDETTETENTAVIVFSGSAITVPDVSAVTAEEQAADEFLMSYFGAMMAVAMSAMGDLDF